MRSVKVCFSLKISTILPLPNFTGTGSYIIFCARKNDPEIALVLLDHKVYMMICRKSMVFLRFLPLFLPHYFWNQIYNLPYLHPKILIGWFRAAETDLYCYRAFSLCCQHNINNKFINNWNKILFLHLNFFTEKQLFWNHSSGTEGCFILGLK